QLGRPVLQKPWFRHFAGKNIDLGKSEGWFRSHGTLAILISRMIPGTRLPTYLAAGLLKVPAARFVAVTAGACLVWVAGLFWFSYHIGMMVISAFQMFRSEAAKLFACALLAVIVGWPFRKLLKRISFAAPAVKLRKMVRWEFWPMHVFYVPVFLKYVTLAIRYRGFGLPMLANPGMHTGGLIGESKFETLAQLGRCHPEFVANTHLVPFHSPEQQLAAVERLVAENALRFPLVFKPDVGQRGAGFKVIHSEEEARAYVKRFPRDLLVQRYVPGPYEVGIFYYRFPNEEKGRIFAITEKVFPFIQGDGRHTLEELIQRDPRASIVAEIYLERFAADRGRTLTAGETIRLVEAGNHCQGAIFLDGRRLNSAKLEETIDRISRSVTGFFVGRYDLRYTSEESLWAGKGFQIVELNGVSSEATNIYDPANSLWNAYRTLFRQWEIIFAIADQNRKRGLNLTPLSTVWKNWSRYRHEAAAYPASD
ncbi:MAG TPA: VTT domain-containing protein, partial [Candidatus Solibacter sp.]|nr:VTT domain-containing protein [Candidatus Solibacter sp.]